MVSMTQQEMRSEINSIVTLRQNSTVIKVTADSGTEGITSPNGLFDKELTINIYNVKLTESGIGVTFDYIFDVFGFIPTEMDLSGIDISGFDSLSFPTMTTVKKLNLSGWDVSLISINDLISKITGRFSNVEELNLSNWNTGSVTDMGSMFYYCTHLTSLNLSNWNTSNVTDMGNMFYHCNSLTSLNLSGWNTSNVTNMASMFRICSSLTSLDLSSFDTSNIEYMYNMFENCSSLTSLNLSNFDTSNVTNMASMFEDCSSLNSLDLSNWNTSNVTNMASMFEDCSSLTSLNLSNFDTSNIEYMGNLFSGCSSLTSLNLSNFDTSNVTNMSYMFKSCSSLTSLNLSNFDTSNVTNMNCMLYGLKTITSLDLSSFDTSNVTDMGGMFQFCGKITEITGIDSWDVSNVTNMENMFSDCYQYHVNNIGSWDVSNVTNMSGMFRFTYFFNRREGFDISNWNVENLVNANSMFFATTYCNPINLSNWNTPKLKYMSEMFKQTSVTWNGKYNPSSIDLSNFDTSNVVSSNSCLSGLKSTITVSEKWTLGYSKTLSDAVELKFITSQNELTSIETSINQSINECKYSHLNINGIKLFTYEYLSMCPTTNRLYIVSQNDVEKYCTVIKFNEGKVSVYQRPLSYSLHNKYVSLATSTENITLLNYKLNPLFTSNNIYIVEDTPDIQLIPYKYELNNTENFTTFNTGDTFEYNPNTIDMFTPYNKDKISKKLYDNDFIFDVKGFEYTVIPQSEYTVMKNVQYSRMYKTSNKKLIIIASIVANQDYGKLQRLVSYSFNKADSNGINLKSTVLNTYFYCIINDEVRKEIYSVKDEEDSQHYILQNSVEISSGDKIYIELELELE